jgi:mannitol/fructose-specific phosphotransferase system IIA component (Ntr-type)
MSHGKTHTKFCASGQPPQDVIEEAKMTANPLARQLLTLDIDFPSLDVEARARVLRAAARRAIETSPDLDAEALAERLEAREAEAPTLLGEGVACPHATLEGIPEAVLVEVRIAQGVRWAGNQMVRRCVVLVEPPGNTGEHLEHLREAAYLASH